MRIWQEFFCNKCVGYFRVKLNMALNMKIRLRCPNPACHHIHHRCISKGMIIEKGRDDNGSHEEIVPPKSSYSKKPWTKAMEKESSQRDGIAPKKKRDLTREAIMSNRWRETFGGDVQ